MSDAATPPSAKPRRRWRRVVLELAVVAGVLLAVRAYRMRDLAEGPFPVHAVRTLAGDTLRLGGPSAELTLVHVWATWCPTCRAMEGAVESASAHLNIVTIAAQSGSDAVVQAYVREHGVTVPVINDPSNTLVRSLGVRAYPTTFFVDRAGRIVAREVGYTTELGLRARAALAAF